MLHRIEAGHRLCIVQPVDLQGVLTRAAELVKSGGNRAEVDMLFHSQRYILAGLLSADGRFLLDEQGVILRQVTLGDIVASYDMLRTRRISVGGVVDLWCQSEA